MYTLPFGPTMSDRKVVKYCPKEANSTTVLTGA